MGRLGVREPGRLLVLRGLPRLRGSGVGRGYGVVGAASRLLAFGCLGAAVRARARRARGAFAHRAACRRDRAASTSLSVVLLALVGDLPRAFGVDRPEDGFAVAVGGGVAGHFDAGACDVVAG